MWLEAQNNLIKSWWLPRCSTIAKAIYSQYMTIFEHFLAHNFCKFLLNTLKFSEKVLPIDLYVLCKIIIIEQYLHRWHSSKKQYFKQIEKNVDFWQFLGTFYPLTPMNKFQITWNFQRSLFVDNI